MVTGPTGSGKSTTLAALVDYINDQPQRPHHHHRGPDRVRAREQKCLINQREVGRAHRLVRARAARGPARGPGHHPGGRDARPRDHLARDLARPRPATSCSRTLHTNSARQDHRPHHRHLPGRPAAAGPRDAVGVAARGRGPDAVAQHRGQRAGRGGRDPGRCSVDPQPDPRGQVPQIQSMLQTGSQQACRRSTRRSGSDKRGRITRDEAITKVGIRRCSIQGGASRSERSCRSIPAAAAVPTGQAAPRLVSAGPRETPRHSAACFRSLGAELPREFAPRARPRGTRAPTLHVAHAAGGSGRRRDPG